jgi:Zn-dependent protease with chaperone function
MLVPPWAPRTICVAANPRWPCASADEAWGLLLHELAHVRGYHAPVRFGVGTVGMLLGIRFVWLWVSSFPGFHTFPPYALLVIGSLAWMCWVSAVVLVWTGLSWVQELAADAAVARAGSNVARVLVGRFVRLDNERSSPLLSTHPPYRVRARRLAARAGLPDPYGRADGL